MAGLRAGRATKEFKPDYGSNVAAEFELWLEDVNDYLAVCKITEPSEKKQLFMNLAGLGLRRIVKGLVVPPPPPLEDGTPGDGYRELTDAVMAHFRPSVKTTSERHKLRQLRRQEHESVTAFLDRLRAKVELCDFDFIKVDTVVNGQLRDQLIAGLQANEIRKELLKVSKLTLAEAMDKAVALEAFIADSSLYEDQPLVASSVVNKVVSDGTNRAPTCRYCGQRHKRGKKHCPAAETQCSYCKKAGHFATVCFRKRKPQARAPVANTVEEQKPSLAVEEELNTTYDSVYALQGSRQKDRDFYMTLKVNGTDCRGLLDTGATRTLTTEDLVTGTKPSSTILRAYDGNQVKTVGVADVTLQAGDRSCTCTCFVVPLGRPVLFGQDAISQLHLLARTDINMVKVEPVDITVDPEASPVALLPRLPAFSIRKER
jgi:hypothetical protein